jgi:hypothetical protein
MDDLQKGIASSSGRCQSRASTVEWWPPFADGGAGSSPSGGAFGFRDLLRPIWPSFSTFHAATDRPDRGWPSLSVYEFSRKVPSQ